MMSAARQKLIEQYFITNGLKLTFYKEYSLAEAELSGRILYVHQGQISGSLQKGKQSLNRFIFGPGSIINLQAVLILPRDDLQYRVLTLSKVYSLEIGKVFELLETDITFTRLLLFESLSQNIYRAERTENLLYKFVSDRVIYQLLYLAERFGIREERSIYITLNKGQQGIADAIGSTRETVSRELMKLENEGYITNSYRQVVIHDVIKLTDRLHEKLRSDWSVFKM